MRTGFVISHFRLQRLVSRPLTNDQTKLFLKTYGLNTKNKIVAKRRFQSIHALSQNEPSTQYNAEKRMVKLKITNLIKNPGAAYRSGVPVEKI